MDHRFYTNQGTFSHTILNMNDHILVWKNSDNRMEPDYTIQSISLYNLSVCIYKCKPCDILRIPLHKNENIFYAHKTSHITFYREDTLHNQIDKHGNRAEFYRIFGGIIREIDFDCSRCTDWGTDGHTRALCCTGLSISEIWIAVKKKARMAFH